MTIRFGTPLNVAPGHMQSVATCIYGYRIPNNAIFSSQLFHHQIILCVTVPHYNYHSTRKVYTQRQWTQQCHQCFDYYYFGFIIFLFYSVKIRQIIQMKHQANIFSAKLASRVISPFIFTCEWCGLTHCRQNELSHAIYWKILILTLGMSGYVI